jgi:hypothetical protein
LWQGGAPLRCWPVDLQAVESPFHHGLAHERPRVRAHWRIRGAQVRRVPPGDLARAAGGIEEQLIGMLAQEARARVRGERRPPQHRFQALRMDAVHERLHVGIAARELGRHRHPVALGHLPPVVERGPGEPQPLGDR